MNSQLWQGVKFGQTVLAHSATVFELLSSVDLLEVTRQIANVITLNITAFVGARVDLGNNHGLKGKTMPDGIDYLTQASG